MNRTQLLQKLLALNADNLDEIMEQINVMIEEQNQDELDEQGDDDDG